MKTRTLLISFGFLFLTGLLVNSGYAIDPVGQWHLDEGSGNVVKDSSGKNRNGEIKGDAKWVDGKTGKALQFDGKDSYVQIPSDGVPNQYTLLLWINQASADKAPGDDAAGGSYGQTILSSSSAAGGYGFWLLTHNGDAIRFYSFETGAPLENSLLTKPGVISVKKWYHIAATAVKGGDSIIYVDGVEKARWKNKGLDVKSVMYYIGDLRTDRKICFNGIIDEVTIFDVVLPAAEIAKIATGTTAVSPSGKLTTVWGLIKNR